MTSTSVFGDVLAAARRFWAIGGATFPKMVDSPPWTPINHRAKCDAASFILAREIRNRTSTQTKHSKRYIHKLPIGMCG